MKNLWNEEIAHLATHKINPEFKAELLAMTMGELVSIAMMEESDEDYEYTHITASKETVGVLSTTGYVITPYDAQIAIAKTLDGLRRTNWSK